MIICKHASGWKHLYKDFSHLLPGRRKTEAREVPLWALHCPLLAVPAVGRMLGAETGPREPSVVNGDNGRRFWAPDETPQDSVLPKEQRDWDNRPPQSRLHGAGHPLASGSHNP